MFLKIPLAALWKMDRRRIKAEAQNQEAIAVVLKQMMAVWTKLVWQKQREVVTLRYIQS